MLSQPALHVTNQTAEQMIISYHPIGEFHTKLTPQMGAPNLDIKPWIPSIDCPTSHGKPVIENDLVL
jgi:hypothetical protein